MTSRYLWNEWNQIRMGELTKFVTNYNARKLPSTPSIGAIPFIYEMNTMIKQSKTKCDLPTMSFNYDKNFLLDVKVIHLDTMIELDNLFTQWTTMWYRQAQALPGLHDKIDKIRLATQNVSMSDPLNDQIKATKDLGDLEVELRTFYDINLKTNYIAHRNVIEMGQVI